MTKDLVREALARLVLEAVPSSAAPVHEHLMATGASEVTRAVVSFAIDHLAAEAR
jgi:hypothetical protein